MVLVHQIWLQGAVLLPEKYKIYSKEYKELNDKYILWDDKMIQRLIKRKYAYLLHVYVNYPFWIMKVDLAKYIILHQFGGIYVDMDTKPLQPFDDIVEIANGKLLFYYKKFSKIVHILTTNKYINNNFMYSPCPKHPFFEFALNISVKKAKRRLYDFKIHYILNSIGPHFLMNVIRKYIKKNTDNMVVITEEEIDNYFIDEEAKSWITSFEDAFDREDLIRIVTVFPLIVVFYKVAKF
jgi:mannosyltransferase OCH1-like enzyme